MLEQAVLELEQWRSQSESRKLAADGLSEPAAVGAPEADNHAVAVNPPTDGLSEPAAVGAPEAGDHAVAVISPGEVSPVPRLIRPSASDMQITPSSSKGRKIARKLRELKLEQSIWDGSLLMGAEGQGGASTVWAIMLLLANILVQGVFAYIVSKDLTVGKYTDARAASYRDWRIQTGHALEEYNPISGHSLAARVCSNDPALAANGVQANAFKEITGVLMNACVHVSPYTRVHLPHVPADYLPLGPLLATLCCFVWHVWYEWLHARLVSACNCDGLPESSCLTCAA